jgi:hypothetical protein
MNAKPRDRPVSRSVMIDTDVTDPKAAKKSRNSSSLVFQERFPT